MKMTVHRQPPHLHCHHCDHQSAIPAQCPHCHSQQLEFIGSGTERTELALTQLFPNTPIYRIDRDSTQHKQAFEDIINTIHSGEPCILVGTQMLAKGHHFPNVTLVGIIEADAGLFSADFRSSERFGQLLTQVAGRAGRAEKPGKVLIQTHLPEHPLLNSLITEGYSIYGRNLLAERRQNALPPFCQMSLIRANHIDPMKGQLLLQQARLFLDQQNQSLQTQSPSTASASCWGPTQAPVAKRAGRYRWQLYLQTTDRRLRHQLLNRLIAWLNQQPLGKSVRWSIDIDPMDIY
jgi:primosomal protein N' (replication factor Y)